VLQLGMRGPDRIQARGGGRYLRRGSRLPDFWSDAKGARLIVAFGLEREAEAGGRITFSPPGGPPLQLELRE
jgi:hypothetical protein